MTVGSDVVAGPNLTRGAVVLVPGDTCASATVGLGVMDAGAVVKVGIVGEGGMGAIGVIDAGAGSGSFPPLPLALVAQPQAIDKTSSVAVGVSRVPSPLRSPG